MKLYDEKQIISIKMHEDAKPDWATDFFNAANLEYNEEIDAYKVDDVNYCIEQAQDWKNGTGDYLEYGGDASREVLIERLTRRKYIAFDGTNAQYDSEEYYYDTLEEANNKAIDLWAHKTDKGKAKVHVCVGYVEDTTMYFPQDVLDAEEMDWTAYHSWNVCDGCFDSEKEGK